MIQIINYKNYNTHLCINIQAMSVIHIHEVLDIIYNSEKVYTIEELNKEVIENYGEDISITSCSDHEFEINDMVNFMLERGKIEMQGDKIYPIGNSCNH